MSCLHIRRFTALFAVLCLFSFSVPAFADESEATEDSGSSSQATMNQAFDIGLDVLVLRPLGTVGLAAGAVLFVPAVIFSAPGGSEGVKDSLDIFIQTPWRDLFERPLGDI